MEITIMNGLVTFSLILHGLLAALNGHIITRDIERSKYNAEIKGDTVLTLLMALIVMILSVAIAYAEVVLMIFLYEMLQDIVLLFI
jgi:hypothetical protein